MGKVPTFGRCPKIPLLSKPRDKIFETHEFTHDIKTTFEKIKETISCAQQQYKQTTNKNRFSFGDKRRWMGFPKILQGVTEVQDQQEFDRLL